MGELGANIRRLELHPNDQNGEVVIEFGLSQTAGVGGDAAAGGSRVDFVCGSVDHCEE
jgi:hypothetical protein